MNLKKLFKFLKIVVPVVLANAPQVIEAVKRAKEAAKEPKLQSGTEDVAPPVAKEEPSVSSSAARTT